MNNLVPVRDSAHQWKTLFTRLSEGKLPNINEITLDNEPVDGLPPSVTDINGEYNAPQDAGNVLPPPPPKIPVPEIYHETVPVGTYGNDRLKEMGRPRKTTRKSASRKKRTTKRKSSAGKKKTKRRHTVRKRKSIVKRRS